MRALSVATALIFAAALNFAAGVARAAEPQIVDLVASLASELTAGNVEGFMKSFDPAMPDYERLRALASALIEQAQVSSSIRIVNEKGDDTTRDLELDWLMDVTTRVEPGVLERRRQIVTCRLESGKKGWRITLLRPVEFFAPPRIGKPSP